MTQKEFEDLTGLKVDLKTYEVVNGMYMANDNMDKQTFCKMFKQMNLGKWAEDQANYIQDLRKCANDLGETASKVEKESAQRIADLEQEVHDLKQKQNDFYLMSIVMLHSYQQDMLCQAIAKQMGAKEYLKALKNAEVSLNKGDIDIVMDAIEGKEGK